MFIISNAKKLALVLLTIISMIITNIKAVFVVTLAIDDLITVLSFANLILDNFFFLFKHMLSIYYLIQFEKN